MAQHPIFLRLFYMLALEATEDEGAAEVVHRVRRRAYELFHTAITRTFAERYPDLPERAADELARFAVAYSDGCFFAGQLEAAETDLRQMYLNLGTALEALAPIAIARAEGA